MLELSRYIKLDDSVARAGNLCDRFSPDDLRRIGHYVYEGYIADLRSRDSWLQRNQAGMELALQLVKEKSFPWPGASNVAFPLITIGALQFHARAYPAIVDGSEVVRIKDRYTTSPEELRYSTEAANYMNIQLLEGNTGWEEGTDRLLLHYSIVGCAFKKSYFSSKEADVCSEFVFANDLVMDYYAKSVESCRRKTHRFYLSRNDLIEGMRAEPPKYRPQENEAWFTAGPSKPAEGDATEEPRSDGAVPPPTHDPSTPFQVLEQHCWLDLDHDGYEEPYIVTIEAGSKEPLRIAARWERPGDVVRNSRGKIVSISATEYFTKYGFIPSPDGSVYDIGFGVLLGPLNESVNTLINQLVDAGTLGNTGGGFLGRGVKIRGGTYSFAPGEWKRVDSPGEDLAKNIVPHQHPQPSPVLFQLLGLLVEYTNRISGAMESMVGENPGQNTPKSNMDAMIEQGMKIYTAIFKRCWRSMKEEFRKIYILNGIFAPPAVAQWFKGDPRRCSPAADPNISSDAERRTRAILIAERASVVPGYDPLAVEHNYLRALHVPNPGEFYKGPPKEQPPSEKIQVEGMKQQGKDKDRQARQQELVIQLLAAQRKDEAEILALQAKAVSLMASAEGERDNQLIVAMQTAISAMKERGQASRDLIEQLIKLAELESEPERKTPNLDNIRRLAYQSANGSAATPFPAQA